MARDQANHGLGEVDIEIVANDIPPRVGAGTVQQGFEEAREVLLAAGIADHTFGAGQLRHELRCFGVGQGGVMTGLTLRPLRKFFTKLLGQFGRIAKSIVVDVDILRDYRLDAPADTVRGSRASRSKSA